VELFNALAFSAVPVALAIIAFMTAPRHGRWRWVWIGVAVALILCAVALPIGLYVVPSR
jgi:hypothetical protein